MCFNRLEHHLFPWEGNRMCRENLVPLLLVGVQSPGQVPGLSVLLLRLSLILLQCPLVHLPSQEPVSQRETVI